MKRNLLRILTVTILLSASAVSAQETKPITQDPIPTPIETPQQSSTDRLLFLLSGYHYFPTQDDLKELGDDEKVASMLRNLASETSQRPTIRLKAVDALAYYSDKATLGFLEYLIATDWKTLEKNNQRTAKLMSHHAIMSFAKSQKEAALPTLEAALTGADLQLKLTTISAIGKHGGEDGKARLTRLNASESNAVAKREIRKYVH